MAAAEDLIELIKVVGGPSAVVALGWWMRGKFSDMQAKNTADLALHEIEDERRHRQNLVRFAKINMKLHIDDEHETNGKEE